MQIVIDIPKITYENWAKIANAGHEPLGYAERTILRGTPLPKGHGRLIDADQLLKEARDIVVPVYPRGYEYRCYCVPADSIYEAPTIIEADKEAADGK